MDIRGRVCPGGIAKPTRETINLEKRQRTRLYYMCFRFVFATFYSFLLLREIKHGNNITHLCDNCP